MTSTIRLAVDSILAGDARRSADFGGQRLTSISAVFTEGEIITAIEFNSGRTISNPVIPRHLMHLPKDRSICPGDIHDAVKSVLLAAVEGDK